MSSGFLGLLPRLDQIHILQNPTAALAVAACGFALKWNSATGLICGAAMKFAVPS